MEIRGRGGVDLREHWGSRPRAYLGMTVPGFPNFFCLYGPGTNLASGGSLIFASECEVRYVSSASTRSIARRSRVRWSRAETGTTSGTSAMPGRAASTMVWASPHIEHNYYKNADGDVHGLNPWRLVDYWTWTRTPDLDDFVLT